MAQKMNDNQAADGLPKKKAGTISTEASGKKGKADFPKMSLKDALAVPNALQKNGGQPLPAIDMATAVDKSPGSSGFRTITASASAYGLIGGSYKTVFTMRELGEAITQPKSLEEASQARVTATLTPGTFRSIFDYYKGKKFPERQFFVNTIVREFAVDPKQADACCQVFETNMRLVGLIRETPGGDWLATEAAPTVVTKEEIEQAQEEAADVEASTDGLSDEDQAAAARIAEIKEEQEPSSPILPKFNRKVFISHGKNKKVVTQLKELLTYGEFEPVVSVERETTSKPVPDKVMGDMRLCGAGIIHVGTERTIKDEHGEEHHFLNENVLIEIGAAMALYDGRFILLVEKGTKLPSNLQGLYEVRFEGEGLDHDATMKLLKAFNEFKAT
jgi:predicted nucleotide-binding protein